jgi:hypothetical protein
MRIRFPRDRSVGPITPCACIWVRSVQFNILLEAITETFLIGFYFSISIKVNNVIEALKENFWRVFVMYIVQLMSIFFWNLRCVLYSRAYEIQAKKIKLLLLYFIAHTPYYMHKSNMKTDCRKISYKHETVFSRLRIGPNGILWTQ